MMPAQTIANPEIKIPSNMSWYPGFIDRWLWRREQVILAIAKGYCLLDPKAHLHLESVRPFLPEQLRRGVGPTPCQMLYVGAPRTAIARLRQGNLGIEDGLQPWTPEFFLGLRMSGALSEKEAGRFRIDTRSHPELIQDIAEWHIAGRVGCNDGFGRRRLLGCLVASHLPVQDRYGASVVAGLFAGARLTQVDGEEWLELPNNEAVNELLENWTILRYPSRCARGRHYLKIPPFYGALFINAMPTHSRRRILGIRKPAMSPALAILYWEWLFGPISKGMRVLPFADALPFGCSLRSFYRKGWRREGLHYKAVSEYKILSINFRLRDLLRQWFESHHANRIKS
jgi:hypothetical protein